MNTDFLRERGTDFHPCYYFVEMNTADILFQFEYNRWANARILNTVSALTNEQFLKELGSSYSSVRDTVTHILAAEEVWLMRWKGISPKTMLDPAYFPDVRSIQAKWAEVELDQWNFLSKISDESLQESVEYQNFKGEVWEYTLWQMIHHMVSHSTYHRGQVVAMLRQLGSTAPSFDFLVYIDLKREESGESATS
jgi:uncharacterized damage-inducible protein DinB